MIIAPSETEFCCSNEIAAKWLYFVSIAAVLLRNDGVLKFVLDGSFEMADLASRFCESRAAAWRWSPAEI
jgi:hypothetical protein